MSVLTPEVKLLIPSLLLGFCLGCSPVAQWQDIGVLEPVGGAGSSEDEGVNIIILFADDMGYGDLGSYGHPSMKTPQLDQLAVEGQRWTDFYVVSPVCSPSRGALMTGNLPERSGLYGRKKQVLFPNDIGAIPNEQLTLAEALKEMNYSTAMFGKWHLGDQPEGLPTRHGFDEWYGIPYSNDMDWDIGPSSSDIFLAASQGDMNFVVEALTNRKVYSLEPKREYWKIPLIRSLVSEGGYEDEIIEHGPDQSKLTEAYTVASVDYIKDRANSNQPFFLYVSYAMPHVPLFPGDKFKNTSAAGRYGDVIEEIDWSVGAIRQAVEDAGIAENTLLIFSSDNGPWLAMDQAAGSAGPLRNGKGSTFEGGVRVPGIFWWPGKIKPEVVSGIGTMMDVYATALSLANAPSNPQAVDTIDLSPALFGQPSPRESFAYYRQGELYAFRQGPYKIHLITQGAYNEPPARIEHERPLLFHLGEDPGERFDIASREPQLVEQLLKAVEQHRAGMVIVEPIFDLVRE